MDAPPPSTTRSGRAYSKAAGVFLTPIACPSAFRIAPLLQDALNRELDALPDIPVDGSLAGLTRRAGAPDTLLQASRAPIPAPLPYQPLPHSATCCTAKRGASMCEEALGDHSPPPAESGSPTHLPPSPPTPLPPKKRPRTEARKERRATHRRKKADAAFVASGQQARPEVTSTLVAPGAVLSTPLDIRNLPANSSGYEARIPAQHPRRKLELQELLGQGWTKVEWDGSESKLCEDPATKRIWAFCVGRVADPTFDQACRDAAQAIHDAGMEWAPTFSAQQTDHKRGDDFAALNTGIFYGHGPPRPYNLLNSKHQGLVDALLANRSIQRLATFQSSSLALYAPRLYAKYHQQHVATLQHCPWLRPNFTRSVYAATAFNFGPQVCTVPHVDCMNFAPGLCAVHGLGRYDYTKGGHLVLMEAQLVIEFPPGCLILIPSATVTHANTPVQPGEMRVSFTQYTPGALFRYMDSGFRTQGRFAEQDPVGYASMVAKKATRWEESLKLWPTFDELTAQAVCDPAKN